MRKLLLAGLVLLSNLTMWSQATTAQTVSASVARQTSQQISDAIQARITESQSTDVSEEGPRNQVWLNFAHEYADGNVEGIDFSGHAYGPLIGVDSAISDFYLGLTLQYLRFNAEVSLEQLTFFNAEVSLEQFTSELDLNLYGIAPYVAWVVSDYFFVSLLAGYYAMDPGDDTLSYPVSETTISPPSETTISPPEPCRRCGGPGPQPIPINRRTQVELDTIHSGFYEIDFNAMLRRERLEVVVKAGFNHDFSKGLGESFDNFYTFIAGADVGYRIGKVKHYVRAWWEGDFDDTREAPLPCDQWNPEHGCRHAPGRKTDFSNTGFFGAGVTVDVTNRFTIGLNGWAAVGGEFDVITHGGLTLRYKF
ncbi:MAG: autotransporter domain-containing protein [Deltaproteobacteria bacterium]|nr:autotransporter domain-containing protein [Deltaproteobacteria bacterium]